MVLISCERRMRFQVSHQ